MLLSVMRLSSDAPPSWWMGPVFMLVALGTMFSVSMAVMLTIKSCWRKSRSGEPANPRVPETG